jgi:hypothetical protein
MYVQHDLKNDLKNKHTGTTGTYVRTYTSTKLVQPRTLELGLQRRAGHRGASCAKLAERRRPEAGEIKVHQGTTWCILDVGVSPGTSPPTPGPRATSGDRHPTTSRSGWFPNLHARRRCGGDSRGGPRRSVSRVRAVARVQVYVVLHSLLLSTGCRVSSQNTRGSQCTWVPFSNQKVDNIILQ